MKIIYSKQKSYNLYNFLEKSIFHPSIEINFVLLNGNIIYNYMTNTFPFGHYRYS